MPATRFHTRRVDLGHGPKEDWPLLERLENLIQGLSVQWDWYVATAEDEHGEIQATSVAELRAQCSDPYPLSSVRLLAAAVHDPGTPVPIKISAGLSSYVPYPERVIGLATISGQDETEVEGVAARIERIAGEMRSFEPPHVRAPRRLWHVMREKAAPLLRHPIIASAAATVIAGLILLAINAALTG